MKKKHIFPNPILVIGGRILLILINIFVPFIWLLALIDTDITAIVLTGILTIPMVPCIIVVNRFLWSQCFGEIIVTEKEIIYLGLFLPIVRLRYDEIKHVDIRTFDEGNVMFNRNVGRNSINIDMYKFILISPKPLPRVRIDKIRSSRKRKLIKFAVSKKLCEAIVDKLPEMQSRIVDHQLLLYKKGESGFHSRS